MTACVGAVVEGRGEIEALPVLVLYDADDNDPEKVRHLTLETLAAVQAVVAVVVRECEAWFLAAAESLRSHAAVRDDASFDGNPERPCDA